MSLCLKQNYKVLADQALLLLLLVVHTILKVCIL